MPRTNAGFDGVGPRKSSGLVGKMLKKAFGLKWPAIVLVVFILFVQIVSTAFFVFNLLSELFLWHFAFIPWDMQEILEVMSSVGLLLGVCSTVFVLHFNFRRMTKIEDQLNAAAGQFQVYLEQQFGIWALSPTERRVALLVIKGFSNAEIAGLRGTTESTVKSQITAIFRKANLTSRQQLVAFVIEDLVAAV